MEWVDGGSGGCIRHKREPEEGRGTSSSRCSQYRTKERVTCIGSAECTSHKELFRATVRETCTAKLDTALHQAESPFQSDAQSQSNKMPPETCSDTNMSLHSLHGGYSNPGRISADDDACRG